MKELIAVFIIGVLTGVGIMHIAEGRRHEWVDIDCVGHSLGGRPHGDAGASRNGTDSGVEGTIYGTHHSGIKVPK